MYQAKPGVLYGVIYMKQELGFTNDLKPIAVHILKVNVDLLYMRYSKQKKNFVSLLCCKQCCEETHKDWQIMLE